MIGPLAHLHNLKRLQEGTTWKGKGNRNRRRISAAVQETIEKRYVNWIKSQSISMVQKDIVDEIADGN